MPAVMSSAEEDTGSEDEAAVIAPENRQGKDGEMEKGRVKTNYSISPSLKVSLSKTS